MTGVSIAWGWLAELAVLWMVSALIVGVVVGRVLWHGMGPDPLDMADDERRALDVFGGGR